MEDTGIFGTNNVHLLIEHLLTIECILGSHIMTVSFHNFFYKVQIKLHNYVIHKLFLKF